MLQDLPGGQPGSHSAVPVGRRQALGFVADAQERVGALPIHVTMREAWLAHADIREGTRVVEVGCGTGVVTRDIARLVGPFGRVIGIDPSESLLRVASRLSEAAGLSARVELRQGDAANLALPPNAYDTAVACMVFQHLPEPKAALRELRRVMRPGARLVAFEQDIEGLQVDHPDRALTRMILQNAAERYVLSPDAARRLPGLVTELGFAEVEVLTFLQAERAEGHLFGLLLRLADFAVMQGRVRGETARQWTATLERKVLEGTFFASLPHYALVAQKPALGLVRTDVE